MKNKKILIILTIIFITSIIVLIYINNNDNNKTNYRKYSYFTDINWKRETDSDIEYLRFNSDGTLSYYCSCGTPINNSDLCDKYSYNEKRQTIKLTCLFKPKSTITKIKINSYDANSLELDFNGEIRKFTR